MKCQMNRVTFFCVALIMLLFSGCASSIPSLAERGKILDQITPKDLKKRIFKTKPFLLMSLHDIKASCEELHIYFEGDGLAWINRRRISDDPTPINPLGFKLMKQDPHTCKVYLARPCQYVTSNSCNKRVWTTHRFSKRVIESNLQALDQLKQSYKNKTFRLIGYSGGGAIASLVASQRDDVSQLITIAGNLDHKKWTEEFSLDPLRGSLNPADFANDLASIKQVHMIGKRDLIIPQSIFFSYYKNFENKRNISYKLYDATHSQNWEKQYKEFLKGIK